MYKKIKNNITSPRKIYLSRTDSGKKVVGYIAFLVLLMLIPTIISVITFDGLEPENRRMIRNDFKSQLDIDCEISNKLICSDKTIQKNLEFDGFEVVIDPGNAYEAESLTTKVVFTEDFIKILFSKNEVAKFTYSDLPSNWQGLKFDVNDDDFWDSLFDGFDELVNEYKSIWIATTIIAFIIIFTLTILLEALLDAFIINLFRFGRLKFKETFKIVIYSMTLYVIIRVILDLYNIRLTGMALSFLQMIPLVYALVALRNAYRE